MEQKKQATSYLKYLAVIAQKWSVSPLLPCLQIVEACFMGGRYPIVRVVSRISTSHMWEWSHLTIGDELLTVTVIINNNIFDEMLLYSHF